MDKPYNLCPSLHIALRTILAVTYARHTRGWAKSVGKALEEAGDAARPCTCTPADVARYRDLIQALGLRK